MIEIYLTIYNIYNILENVGEFKQYTVKYQRSKFKPVS